MLDALPAIASRGLRGEFGQYEGLLLDQSAHDALASRFDSSHLWSPSQLEEYATCPFRFFANELIRLEPLDDLTVASDARRRGSILHQVLAKVHEQLDLQDAADEQDQPLATTLTERFRELLAAEIAARPLGGLQESLREIERREIDAWAPLYAQQECDYRQRWNDLMQPPAPKYFELHFGPEVHEGSGQQQRKGSTPVPFELDLGQEQIRITGQIDRIDVGRIGGLTVLNIIDYKSAKRRPGTSAEVARGVNSSCRCTPLLLSNCSLPTRMRRCWRPDIGASEIRVSKRGRCNSDRSQAKAWRKLPSGRI